MRSTQIASLVTVLMLSGCANNPTGTYRQSMESVDNGTSTRNSISELVDVVVEGNVGPEFSYRVSDRLLRTDSVVDDGTTRSPQERTQNRVSGETVASTGPWRWTQGVEVRHDHMTGSDVNTNTLVRTDTLEKLEWEPPELPKFTTWVNYTTQVDDRFVDREQLESLFQIDEVRGPFDYLYSVQLDEIKDSRADAKRNRLEQIFRGGFSDDLIDDRLTFGVNLFADHRNIRNEFPGSGPGPFPMGEVQATQGLYAIDTTPGTGTLPSLPALIDNDEATSTGINIGGFASGGGPDRNIGVELPTSVTINRVFLITQAEVDPFFLSQFAFSAWVSEDNTLWTLAAPSVSYTYDRTFRRFDLAIPTVQSRFLKIVNTSAPGIGGAVLVTEIRVFTPNPGAGGSRINETRERIDNVTANLTWRPDEDWTFGYDVLLGERKRESDSVRTQDESRVDQGVTGTWRATDQIQVSARARQQTIRDPFLLDQETTFLNGLIEYEPLETLDAALSYTDSRRNREDGADLDSKSLQGRLSAQLLEPLGTQLTYEINRQDDRLNLRSIDRYITQLSIFAQLSPSWRLTLDGRHVDAQVSGPGASGIPIPAEDTAEAILLYQPNSQFTATVEVEWIDNPTNSGVDEIFRLDWIPFPDGAMQIQLDAQRQSSTLTRARVDQYQALMRWTLGTSSFLQVAYNHIIPRMGSEVTSLVATFSVTF